MKIFIDELDCDIWDSIKNGQFVPTYQVNDVKEIKHSNLWTKRINKKCSTT